MEACTLADRRSRLQGHSFVWIMAKATLPPKSIGELIDRIERIQEELLSIQRSLEKMEPIEAAVSSVKTTDTPKSIAGSLRTAESGKSGVIKTNER